MLPWNPPVELTGDRELIRVTASDAQVNPGGCGLFGAVQARRNVRAATWRLRYNDQPFMLKVIRIAVTALHRDDRVLTWEGLQEALKERVAPWELHPGVRAYVEHAVEQYIEAHDELATRFGEARFAAFDPLTGVGGRQLTAWAFLYRYADGTREIRRLRLRTARSAEGPERDRWSVLAAHVAAGLDLRLPAPRVRVVEVGLYDGSTEVTFQGTPQEAKERYEAHVRPAILSFVHSTETLPGRSCGRCKIAGCCTGLTDMSGCLGQGGLGAYTRSVSASDLELYSRCASRWYLERICYLPKDEGIPVVAAERGRLVHRWLADAHARGIRCTPADTGTHGDDGVFAGTLSAEEYSRVREFLAAHVSSCPIGQVMDVRIESPLYGYDAAADVVVATQPDIVYTEPAGQVVIRETKTATEMPEDSNDAFDRFFAAAWLINIAGAAKGAFGGTDALPRVELEVITAKESQVFTWQPEDEGVARMAGSEVRGHVTPWHRDVVWPASPGAQCSWCPVSRWCPEKADPDSTTTGELHLGDEPCAGLPSASPE